MTTKDSQPEPAAELRRRAEAALREDIGLSPQDPKVASPEELRRLVLELQVHQVELQMQNEELRRWKVELDLARARYYDLYDLSPVGLVAVSEDGLILEANLSLSKLLGLPRSELVNRPFVAFLVSEDSDSFYLAHRKLFKTGTPQSLEPRMVDPHGTVFWAHLEMTVVQGADGAPPECRVALSDITERKRTEAALRDSEVRWQFAIDGAGDGLWDWDVAASTVFFSRRWKEMLGFEEDEIGRGLTEWSKRVHPDDLAETMAAVQAHLNGVTPQYASEHRVQCKDGTWKWILDRGAVVSRDAAGQALRMIGTHTDNTARRHLEEALRGSSRALVEAQRIAHVGSWHLDLASDQVEWSNELYLMYGFEPCVIS